MGYTSLKFQNIEKDLITISSKIVANQNICRYVKYLDNNPLDITKLDITDNLIKSENVILSIFNGSVDKYSDIKIFIYPKQGSLKTQPLGEVYFNIDILIPDIYWILEGLGQFRAFRIADEICQLFDGQSEIAGKGKIDVVDFVIYKIANSNYSGLTMRLLVNECTLMG